MATFGRHINRRDASKLPKGPGFNERFTIPMQGIPETTPFASVRNFVHNVKSLPGDFKKLGGDIKKGLSAKRKDMAGKMRRGIDRTQKAVGTGNFGRKLDSIMEDYNK